MAMDIFKLAGSITLDTGKAEAALNKVEGVGKKATEALGNGVDKLGNVVDKTGKRLGVLDASAPLGKTGGALDKTKAIADRFGLSVEDVAAALNDAGSSMDDADAIAERFGIDVEDVADALEEFESAAYDVSDEVDDLGGAADKAAEDIDDLGDEADKTADDIDDLGKESESSTDKMGSAFKKLGGIIVAAFAIDKIKDFGMASIEAAAELNAMAAQFDQTFGGASESAKRAIAGLSDEFKMVDTRITPLYTMFTSKFKGLGLETEAAMDKAGQATRITADAAAYFDIAFETAQSHLNSFVNGSYEGGEAIGLFANETQLAAYAVEQGVIGVKTEWQALDEATKQATRLDFATAMQEAAGATGQATRESGEYANVMGNMKANWEKFLAAVGNSGLLDIAIGLLGKLSDILTNFTENVMPGIQERADRIKELWHEWETPLKAAGAAVGVLAGAFAALAISEAAATSGSVIKAITGIIKSTRLWAAAQWALNVAMSANPIGLVIAAVAALVAVFVVLWNESDAFREAVIGLWEGFLDAMKAVGRWFADDFAGFFVDAWDAVVGFFSDISDWIGETWGKIAGFFSGVWESITGFFSDAADKIAEVAGNILKFFQPVIDFVVGFWAIMGQLIFNWWKGIVGFFVGAFTSAWNFLTEWGGKIVGFFVGVFSSVWDFVTEWWGKITGFFVDAFTAAYDAVVGFLEPIVEWIQEKVSAIFSWLKENIEKAIALYIEILTRIFNFVSDVFTKIVDTAKQWGENIKEAVLSAVQWIGDKLSGIWDWIKDTATGAWNAVYDAISGPIERAVNFVRDMIDRIKGFFDFDISWPKIPLPHFKVKPAGWHAQDLLKGQMPSLSIDWYAKGAVLEEPTIFGALDGRLMAGGEAGPEAVAPISVLQDYVRQAVRDEQAASARTAERILAVLERYLPEVSGNVVLDTGQVVGALAPRLDLSLGREATGRQRGAPYGANARLGW